MTDEQRYKISRQVLAAIVFVLFTLMFVPFATSILLAGLFAFAMHDTVLKLERLKIKRLTGSLILMIGIVIFIALPLTFIIFQVVGLFNEYSAVGLKNTPAYQAVMQLVQQIGIGLSSLARSVNINISTIPKPAEFIADHVGDLGGMATSLAAKVPMIILNLIVFILALFYFLNEYKQVKSTFLKWKILPDSETNQIIAMVKESSYLTLIFTILVAAMQAGIIALGGLFSGFTDFFVVFICTFVFALVPIVGCAPPALFLILVAAMNNNTTGIVIMAIALVIASTSDNVVKAFALKSTNDEIHPIVSLLALIGAILVYGVPGILLGPILTQLAFKVIPILRMNNIDQETKASTDL